MSEYVGEVDRTDAALPGCGWTTQRKRQRADEDGAILESFSRHVPPHVRVQVVSGEFTSLLSLRGHVLDAHGQFNAAEFPALTFFYNPSVVSVEAGTVVLQLSEQVAVEQYIVHKARHQPCPVHGPFRCPCHIMHEVADTVAQLLREVFCQHCPFDVAIDCQRNYPHLCINSVAESWSVSLFGLPLPPRTYGPFPLGSVTSPQSVKTYWSSYCQRSKVAENACVLCGVPTAIQCSVCLCRVCANCAEICEACTTRVCRGCSATVESGATLCCSCAR